MTKLSNLQIIKRAASMGYAPILQLPTKVRSAQFVNINGDYIDVIIDGLIESISLRDLRIWEITGFIYVGMLFGEPKIEEGQRFRVKETGEVGKYICSGEKPSLALDCVRIETNPQASFVFSKSELEPVFD